MKPMNQIKKWLLKFNPDNPVWCTAIKEATTFDQLEAIANPIASEIGWLHLEQLANIMETWDEENGTYSI